MLLGCCEHSVDGKRRMRIPSDFKSQLNGPLVMCASVNGCISIYTQDVYTEIFSKYATSGVFKAADQKRYTKFFSSVFDVVEDNQGRVLLPEKLYRYASIQKDIVTVGKLNHLEIWAAERLNVVEEEESFEETFEYLSGIEE